MLYPPFGRNPGERCNRGVKHFNFKFKKIKKNTEKRPKFYREGGATGEGMVLQTSLRMKNIYGFYNSLHSPELPKRIKRFLPSISPPKNLVFPPEQGYKMGRHCLPFIDAFFFGNLFLIFYRSQISKFRITRRKKHQNIFLQNIKQVSLSKKTVFIQRPVCSILRVLISGVLVTGRLYSNDVICHFFGRMKMDVSEENLPFRE